MLQTLQLYFTLKWYQTCLKTAGNSLKKSENNNSSKS